MGLGQVVLEIHDTGGSEDGLGRHLGCRGAGLGGSMDSGNGPCEGGRSFAFTELQKGWGWRGHTGSGQTLTSARLREGVTSVADSLS